VPVAWSVLVPLVGAIAALLAGQRLGRWAAVLAALGTLGVTVWAAMVVASAGTLLHPVGGWGAPLGIDLRADGFSALMLMMTSGVGVAVTAYALGYYPVGRMGAGWTPGVSFWPLLLLLWCALNALFLSSDLFNLYVGLELMTLAAVALVCLSDEATALTAGLRYLLAAFLGSLLYLAGVALLYAEFHTLDLTLLGERMRVDLGSQVAAALITAGLALKTALFPLHFWLPRAHSTAPAPVSALLSALVVTASFYMLARLWFYAFGPLLTPSLAQLLGLFGAVAIVWGSLQAIRQQRLKLMVAYSTVAQAGYLFLLFPLLAADVLGSDGAQHGAALAWSGGVYYAVAHAVAKAGMFLAAGNIAKAIGHDRIVGIRGIAAHLPLSTYAFGIAGMSLIGIPPSGGFVGKWLLLSAALATGQWWWAVVILAGGILTAGYIFGVLTQHFSHTSGDHDTDFAPVGRLMEHSAMGLALGAFVLGLVSTAPLTLLETGAPAATIQVGGP
jgi:multicomponent Na+:H+ antiporter subunit D